MQRRQFLVSSLAAAAVPRLPAAPLLRFGHRQANIVKAPGPTVFDLAKRIHGLSGVELQIFFKGTSLWDAETLASFRSAAKASGMAIPSVAGIWPPGASLLQPAAEEHLRKAIRVSAALGATTILAACFEKNCPVMDHAGSDHMWEARLWGVNAPDRSHRRRPTPA